MPLDNIIFRSGTEQKKAQPYKAKSLVGVGGPRGPGLLLYGMAAALVSHTNTVSLHRHHAYHMWNRAGLSKHLPCMLAKRFAC